MCIFQAGISPYFPGTQALPHRIERLRALKLEDGHSPHIMLAQRAVLGHPAEQPESLRYPQSLDAGNAGRAVEDEAALLNCTASRATSRMVRATAIPRADSSETTSRCETRSITRRLICSIPASPSMTT